MAGYIEARSRASLFFCLLVVLALMAPALHAAGDGKEAGKVRGQGGEQGLLDECAARGTVKVLVKVPLGNGKISATEEQKGAAIAEAQDRLVRELSEKGLKPVQSYKYRYTPLMAMTVDTEVLKALLASDNVESVEADIPVRPTKGAG
ncbi:MAG TPA: hypothetical protein VGJ94_09190 [Syntrophorhabdaceae bacterium]|jgi:hypothetical protein